VRSVNQDNVTAIENSANVKCKLSRMIYTTIMIVGSLLINWGTDHPQSLVNSRQDHGDWNGSTSPIVGMWEVNRTFMS
jgi:hypothetical protein